MEKLLKRCVQCKGTTIVREMLDDVITVDGVDFRKMVPVEKCKTCGEVYFGLKADSAFERQVERKLARQGITGPEGFRRLRKAMGMKSANLAELLGVTPETVSRWEKGKRSIETIYLKVVQMLAREFFDGTSVTRKVLRGGSGRSARAERAARLDHHP